MNAELGGMARGNRAYWRANYPTEKQVEPYTEADVEEAGKYLFYVICLTCDYSDLLSETFGEATMLAEEHADNNRFHDVEVRGIKIGNEREPELS